MPSLRLLCSNDCYKAEKFSLLSSLKKKYYSESSITKHLFAGDFLGGSLFSVNTKGESMIQVCNKLDFDYVTIGNHEFDYSARRLQELMDLSSFKWLGSNIRYSSDNKLFHSIVDVSTFDVPSINVKSRSVKIGIFGLCTQDTPLLANPTDFVVFEDVLIHAKRCTNLLRKTMACDIVIAMTHVSLAVDKNIAETAGIDIIIGGHDHDPVFLKHCNTLIIKCGQDLDHLGILDVDFLQSSEGGRITLDYCFTLKSTKGVESDPTVDSVIALYSAKKNVSAEDDGAICIVNDDSELSTLTSDLRSRETAFACILADSLAYSYTEIGYKVDFSIQNGGFIRKDLIYPPGSVITMSTIREELPFPRHPMLIAMKGSDVLLALQQMLPAKESTPVGSFPHLSNGLTAEYGYEESVLVVRNVLVHGTPIVLDQFYSVAISDFYYQASGDGVSAFQSCSVLADHHIKASEVMITYLKTLGGALSALPPKRLIRMQ